MPDDELGCGLGKLLGFKEVDASGGMGTGILDGFALLHCRRHGSLWVDRTNFGDLELEVKKPLNMDRAFLMREMIALSGGGEVVVWWWET